ncbi:transcription termination factor MTERF2, chloroplastic-like [Morus notabilis]|uniref:transcription termination factor MTERF2, chloroplastic-like n=1 Tax=Morus notabilis TaxID=981085 RepID=UPI000CED4D8F|nr:transcription termination factor MTERF2, chloroplastic-like [Morus notabilis]
MSKFLCKTFLFRCHIVRTSPPTSILGFFRNPDIFHLRLFSSSSNQQSFTVSYLINSLGFSPETALSASKYVNFKTPEKPDKLINLFKKYGFTQIQLSNLVRRCPSIFSYDAEKNILPKLEFLQAKGMSGPEMAKRLSVFPTLLRCSLSNLIIPSYDFYRDLFQSDEKACHTVKRFPHILICLKKYVAPNVAILREHGVAKSDIAKMMHLWPKSFVTSPDSFREVVEKVVEMGFDASTLKFVVAVNIFLSMRKSTWESKVDAYKKWGWSEEEVSKAFQSYPWCMMVSEDKLMASMDIFINQMGWRPFHLAKFPTIFTVSLNKRVVPRCSVFQVLLSKGLVKKDANLNSLLMSSEKNFLQRFVAPYKENAPELLKLYKEKYDLSNAAKIYEV